MIQALAEGKHWYIAMLETIALWDSVEEEIDGENLRYLICGEALDMRLLLERLLESADGLIPPKEKAAFLRTFEPPIQISHQECKDIIGDVKYKTLLNYFYGITVEGALISAVRNEVNKEVMLYPCCQDPREFEGAYKRIYGKDKEFLLEKFNTSVGDAGDAGSNIDENMPEFVYWLFKYRLNNSDKARIASDTKKGLEHLGDTQHIRLWT
jgi:hypothetical protein